jgi:Protein of unknown function (DUF1588)/Protein of unknown function (DUF1592)/Protein of unknown function (DUF1595)/Protein of unknown function (DUF1587)/Protein of unknown function (DUF1585)
MVRLFSMNAVATTLAASCLVIAACVGTIGGPTGSSGPASSGVGSNGSGSSAPNGSGSNASSGGAASGVGGAAAGPGTQPAATLHKLTIAEFTNSIHDLLGSNAPVPAQLEPDQQLDGFRSVSASVVSISPMGVANYESAIAAATRFAFSSAAQAATVLPCVPTGVADAVCSPGQALSAFGRRALRRPLTPADVTRYVSVATDIAQEPGSSILIGLQHAVAAILQSPDFLYRVELGAPSAQDAGRNKYTDFEMASRLAWALWVSVPDDTLLDAAAAGTLSTSTGVLAQAKAMLVSPNAHRSIANFVSDLYGMDPSSGTTFMTTIKDPKFFPSWTTTLPLAMQQELFMRVDDVAFTGDYLSLYDSPTVFVNNELALLYGLSKAAVDGFRKVTLPQGSPRLGLLGSGAILASNGLPQRTSPTLRGRFVSEQLLCRTVPPPPPNVNTAVLDTLPPSATVKATLEQHRQNPGCAACHAMMDPVGLGLENFDSIGAYRTTDKGLPIDATGVLDGVSFKDEASLSTALRNDPNAGTCFVNKIYEQLQARMPLAVDAPVLANLAAQFEANGHRADQLLLDIVSSDAYRFVEVATQ